MADSPTQTRLALGLGAAGFLLGLAALWNTLPTTDRAAAAGQPARPNAGWLKGSADERFAAVERHLRGLDVSMAEIGYRYAELLAAAKSRNWDYARYQTEKIDLSLRLAVERRPKREKSAGPFLDESLPGVMRAIKARDGAKLDAAMDTLRTGCIQCHRAENVLYMGTLFATVRPAPPAAAAAIREYQKKLTPESLRAADRSKGRLVFAKHCANCHRLFGDGADNGPDLTGLQRTNLDYLLTRIVDPNGVIGHDYQAVVVTTTDERTFTGLVKQEDDKSLTLQTATDRVVIPKKDVERRSASRLSFMPEGLLQALGGEEVRNLVGYLQGADQVPLPPRPGDKDRE